MTLEVDGRTLVVFAPSRPTLDVGDQRRVLLNLFTTSDYRLTEAGADEEPTIKLIDPDPGESDEPVTYGEPALFRYRIVGTLVDDGVSVGPVMLQHESLSSDNAHLLGKAVSLTSDRIFVQFLLDLPQW
ncbi:MAG TPA: hypothetical protein VHA82_11040 [Ramlibacter sp.]|uniref:hypothetical protein n=1 Tax=Ramlibacter sp. TaxID=1917967 RepID=UPI002B556CEB|nr:hypothetical protein [Ramlibacter sp.]HVZ44335.1 hypothetical protein [Ramlibacter sp.]